MADATLLHRLIEALPKAELHVHIEGTLSPELLFELAKRNGVQIPYKTVEEVRAAYNFTDLQSFLDLYYEGMSVLITEDDFADLAYAYTRVMHESRVTHAEPFFDPQGHLCRGITFRVLYDGLMKGFRRGEAEFGVSVALIFSFLRHLSEEECFALVRDDMHPDNGQYIRELFAAKAFVAVGLDSSELDNPPEKFARLYRYCHEELKVPFLVAHAGEEGPPGNHKKIGGTLIENDGDYFIIGIGMNIAVAPQMTDAGREATMINAIAEDFGVKSCTPRDLANAIWCHFFDICTSPEWTRESVIESFDKVMDKSLKLHKRLPGGRDPEELTAVSLNSWGHLKVRHTDGTLEDLSAEYLF